MRFSLDVPTGAAAAAALLTAELLLFAAGMLAAQQRREGAVGPAGAAHSAAAAPAQRPAPPRVPFEYPRLFDRAPARRPRNAYAPLITAAAIRHALPEELIYAVVDVESDFNPSEVSNKGARGIMQVMPETGARFGVAPSELFDPERNIAAGTAYLRFLLDRYDGDVDLTIAAYNAGEGAVDRYRGIPPYAETQQYVKRVRAALASADEERVPRHSAQMVLDDRLQN